jgi:hypothetical protein
MTTVPVRIRPEADEAIPNIHDVFPEDPFSKLILPVSRVMRSAVLGSLHNADVTAALLSVKTLRCVFMYVWKLSAYKLSVVLEVRNL